MHVTWASISAVLQSLIVRDNTTSNAQQRFVGSHHITIYKARPAACAVASTEAPDDAAEAAAWATAVASVEES